ncbi:carbohydrate ABC transporter permease [Mesorhizobium comanense]|uniref:carbohydrate ABC transporter permease n=1 Tax=Mesorhizobium comanense TaxID=2502215 RepID=UPI0010F955DE|nr:carbohydrate ABC transporter permease [Mesorhizobium comanense]
MTRAQRTILYWLLLSPLLVLILLPYVVMLSTALKPASEVFTFPPQWLPQNIDFSNFTVIWNKIDFARALMNSLYVSVGATVLTLALAIPAAYAMVRSNLPGKGPLRLFLLLTQMISPVVLIIGIFRMMAAQGLVNDHLSLIMAYSGFSVAFAVWMLQSYFETIPREIEEAAHIDGANWFAVLWRIFLPLAMPAIGVTAIFTFIAAWTDFILAFTLLRTPEKLTATMKLFYLVSGTYHVDGVDPVSPDSRRLGFRH